MTEKSRFWDGNSVGDAAVDAPYDAATEFARVMELLARTDQLTNRGCVFKQVPGGALAPTAGAGKITIAAGEAMVYGNWYTNDANVDVTIPTPAASTRIDRIVLRKDWTAQTVRITRVAGVEGGAAPALVQVAGTTWDIPICQVSITTLAAITMTDQREGPPTSGWETKAVRTAVVPDGIKTAFTIGTGVAGVPASQVEVYLNGMRRIQDTDFTHTAGEDHVDFTGFTPETGALIDIPYVPA